MVTVTSRSTAASEGSPTAEFLEGQASARERGQHGGRPKVFDDDMIAYARSLRERGLAVPDNAGKLVIPAGKDKGRHPSVASVYRVLADEGEVPAGS